MSFSNGQNGLRNRRKAELNEGVPAEYRLKDLYVLVRTPVIFSRFIMVHQESKTWGTGNLGRTTQKHQSVDSKAIHARTFKNALARPQNANFSRGA